MVFPQHAAPALMFRDKNGPPRVSQVHWVTRWNRNIYWMWMSQEIYNIHKVCDSCFRDIISLSVWNKSTVMFRTVSYRDGTDPILSQYQHRGRYPASVWSTPQKTGDQISEKMYRISDPVTNRKDYNQIWERNVYF